MDKLRIKPLTILLCIGLFLAFFVIRFPYRNLRGWVFAKIHKATGITILAEDMYLAIFGWPGIGLKNVEVSLPLGDSALDISSETLIVRVGLGSLFPPSPSVSLSLKDLSKGGDLFMKFHQSGTRVSAYVEGEAIELNQLRLSSLPQALDGTFATEVDIDSDTKDLSKTSGSVDLGVLKLKLPAFPIQLSPGYGFVIPAMNVGPLKGKVRIKNGVVEFQNVQFGSATSDLKGSLSGDIRLGQTIYNSSLNITLRLDFSDQIKNNSQSVTMLSFLNTFKSEKTGGYAIKCSKGVPELANCLLIPEKVAD